MEKLFRENRGLIWAIARRFAPLCSPAVDVEDLFQAGFFGLVRASETFEEGRAAWSTWAAYYIRNAMRDALGRHRSQPELVSLDAPIEGTDDLTLGDVIADTSAPAPEAEAVLSDRQWQVRAAVDALARDEYRYVISRKYFDGKTYGEIAGEMGVSAARVSQLAAEGRKRLSKNKSLKAYLDEYTPFIRHKGVTAFNRDWTSTTEAAVLWREKVRERMKSADVCGLETSQNVIHARAREEGGTDDRPRPPIL